MRCQRWNGGVRRGAEGRAREAGGLRGVMLTIGTAARTSAACWAVMATTFWRATSSSDGVVIVSRCWMGGFVIGV